MANDLINHVCIMEPPQNTKRLGLESFLVGEHVQMHVGEVFALEEGLEALFPLSHYLALYISSNWLFLSYILL